MPESATVWCPFCGAQTAPPIDPFAAREFALSRCPECGKQSLSVAFPAARRRDRLGALGAAASDGDAVCFHHQGRRAEAVCDVCGRFLCELCHIDLDGRAVCSACLTQMHTHSAKTKLTGNATSAHVPRCVRYDKIALGCITVVPFIWFLSFINAGVALFLCIRYWRRPISVIPRNRWRFVVAGVCSVGILVLWVWLAIAVGTTMRKSLHYYNRSRQEKTMQEVTHGDE